MANRDGWSDDIPDWYIKAWEAHMEDTNKIHEGAIEEFDLRYFRDGSCVSFEYLDTIGELMKTPKGEPIKATVVDEDGFSKEDLDQFQKIIDKLRATYCNYEEGQ